MLKELIVAIAVIDGWAVVELSTVPGTGDAEWREWGNPSGVLRTASQRR